MSAHGTLDCCLREGREKRDEFLVAKPAKKAKRKKR
jgi:hypothetical protein